MSLNFHIKNEDEEKDESINNYKHLFKIFENNPPTLSEALNQLFGSLNLNEEKSNILKNYVLNQCKNKIEPIFNQIQSLNNNISKEDAYVICSYTCEYDSKYNSLYYILNKNLLSENRQNEIKRVSKFLYLLLKALRKLPKYYPKPPNIYLYRCIKRKVSIKEDQNNKKLIPYKIGNKKHFGPLLLLLLIKN